MTLEQRFEAKVPQRPREGCWLWEGAKRGGYGVFWMGGGNVQATSVALLLAGIPLMQGEWACHTCDNPSCVRPAHLFACTAPENVADMLEKGRQARGENQGLSKLSDESVLALRRRVASGEVHTHRAWGDEYGVSKTTIANVLHGRTHQHLL